MFGEEYKLFNTHNKISELKCARKKPFSVVLDLPKTHIGLNPGRHGEKTAFNSLTCGMTS
jgi:hypothetical protein